MIESGEPEKNLAVIHIFCLLFQLTGDEKYWEMTKHVERNWSAEGGGDYLNGALAGLVSITAGPLDPTLFGALWIGAVGGAVVVLGVITLLVVRRVNQGTLARVQGMRRACVPARPPTGPPMR